MPLVCPLSRQHILEWTWSTLRWFLNHTELTTASWCPITGVVPLNTIKINNRRYPHVVMLLHKGIVLLLGFLWAFSFKINFSLFHFTGDLSLSVVKCFQEFSTIFHLFNTRFLNLLPQIFFYPFYRFRKKILHYFKSWFYCEWMAWNLGEERGSPISDIRSSAVPIHFDTHFAK